MKKLLIAAVFGFLSFSLVDMSVATATTERQPIKLQKIKLSKKSRESVTVEELARSIDNYLKREYGLDTKLQLAKIKFLLNPEPSEIELAAIDSKAAEFGVNEGKKYYKKFMGVYGINLVKQVRRFVKDCVGGKLRGDAADGEVEVSDKLLGDIIHLIFGGNSFVIGKKLQVSDLDIVSSSTRKATRAFWTNVINNALAVTYGDRVGAKRAKLTVTRQVMDKSSEVIEKIKDILAGLGNADTMQEESRMLEKKVDNLIKLINKIDNSGLVSSDGSKGRTWTSTDTLKVRLRELCQALGGIFAGGMANAVNNTIALKSLLLQLIAVVSLAQASENADLLTNFEDDGSRGDKQVTPETLLRYYVDAAAAASPEVKRAYENNNIGEITLRLVDVNYAMLDLCFSDGLPDEGIFKPRDHAVDQKDLVFSDEFMSNWEARVGTAITDEQKKEKFDLFLRCALTMEDFNRLKNAGKLDGFSNVSVEKREEFIATKQQVNQIAENLDSSDFGGLDDDEEL